MLKLLRPKAYRESLLALDPQQLWRQGIRGLILDLDNTVVEWGQTTLRPTLPVLINSFKQQGFKLCLLSNALEARAKLVAAQLGIPYLSQAVKPAQPAFRKALAMLGTTPATTAVVGDQLFTDILGGNRCGCYTILVPPLNPSEFFTTRIVRCLERAVIQFFKRKGTWQ